MSELLMRDGAVARVQPRDPWAGFEEDGAALTGLDLASVDYVAPCAVEGDEDILLLALEDFSLASVIVPPVEGIGNDRAILCDWYLPPGASAGT